MAFELQELLSNQQLVDEKGYATPYFEDLLYNLIIASQSRNRYADKADIDDNIPEPFEDQMVQVTGQGEAIYKSGTWVLASDDTTAIT